MTNEQAIAEIERLARRAGYAPSTFCKYAIGNPHLVARLQAGRQVTIATMQRLRDWKGKRNTKQGRPPKQGD